MLTWGNSLKATNANPSQEHRCSCFSFNNTDDLIRAINNIPPPSHTAQTYMYEAMTKSSEAFAGARLDARHIIILLTDGIPTGTTPGEVIEAASRVKKGALTTPPQMEVDIITVGVKKNLDAQQRKAMTYLLEEVASQKSWFYEVETFEDLKTILSDLVEDTCPYFSGESPDVRRKSFFLLL